MTRDVDATFVPHGVVLEEARNVAEAMRLPPWWLNEQASAYVSTQRDDGKREVFDHPGIRVMAASAEHVFATKAFAARSRDEDDLRTLANIIGITTIDAALELCERFFPPIRCRRGRRRCWKTFSIREIDDHTVAVRDGETQGQGRKCAGRAATRRPPSRIRKPLLHPLSYEGACG